MLPKHLPSGTSPETARWRAHHFVQAVNHFDRMKDLLDSCHHELLGIHDHAPSLAESWGESSRLLEAIERLLDEIESGAP